MIKTLKKISIIYLLLQIGLLTPIYAQAIEQVNNQKTNQYKTATETIKPASSQLITTELNTKPADTQDNGRELSMFFKIGIGINIIMLAAYISWAVRQWRQSNDKKD